MFTFQIGIGMSYQHHAKISMVAHCVVGLYPLLYICLLLDQNYRTIIHILKTIAPRVMEFDQGIVIVRLQNMISAIYFEF